MINVSVETDIKEAMRALNLLPREAERAAYRAMNKVADEIKKDSIQRISGYTGIPEPRVADRFYIKGANAGRLMAVVAALPSARNVGYEQGANPSPGKRGVTVTAWRTRTLYDRTFVKGKQSTVRVRRKVWRRTGPGKNDVSDFVWGPSVRKTFMRPWLQRINLATIQQRWPVHFERYLRGELVKLGKGDMLKGVSSVLPSIAGPQISGE